MFLVPSVGFSICARLSSSAKASKYGSDVDDNWFITWVTTPCAFAVAFASIRFFPTGFLPHSISMIFLVLLRGTISVSQLLVLMPSRLLILPRLVLVICYETE
jgi:hypothetical protein